MSYYFPEHSEAFRKAVEALSGKAVAVLGHLRPDGDCIGSQVALCRVLQHRGIDACCVNQHPVPTPCKPFVGSTPFYQPEAVDLQNRIAVTVDCADRKRIGTHLSDVFPRIELNIDHHISNSGFAEANLVIAHASATGEILAGLLLDLGWEIDAVTAQALYVGIATDTGQFRFSSTTKQTFDICRALMDRGADPAAAALSLYENESPAKLALLQHFLASFEYWCDGQVCIGTLPAEVWGATGAEKEDTEGLVDYARAIRGVEIGILLEEHPNGDTKGSFRAKDARHRVDELARQFNGGGHACAAGFNPHKPIAQCLPELKQAMEAHFAALNATA